MIGILTDSTCDLPVYLISRYNISILPMTIRMNGKEYLDRITLSGDLFYRLLIAGDRPETEPPSVDEFINRYAEMLLQYDHIISIHVGSAFSQTVQNAGAAVSRGRKRFFETRLKAKLYKPFKISIIDSKTVSIGVGLLVVKAARLLQEQPDATDLVDTLEDCAARLRVIFSPKDLSYLHRSKRLTGIKYLIAHLAGLKPLIQVANGTMEKFAAVRGVEHAADAIVKEINRDLRSSPEIHLAIAYAGMQADIEKNILAHRITDVLKGDPGYFESIIGPTIGTHCGPDAVCAAFLGE
ncbi:MAG: DegV family protein [Pseudomonadota bacterium]